MNKKSIWTKDFILVCLAALATNICMRMLDSNLASYANIAWNSKSLGGQLTSFFNFGSILMAFFGGRIADIKGRRISIIYGCLLFAVPTIAMALIPLPGVALGVRVLQGVAKGIVTVAMASVVSDIVARDQMNEGMGMFNLGNTISFAFWPMRGLALVDMGGYSTMFLVCSITYALGVVFAWFMNYEKKQKSPVIEADKENTMADKTPAEYKGIWKLIEKKAIIASLINTIFFGGYACILVFLTVYAQEVLLLNSTQISFFYTVAAVAMLAVRLLTAKVADRYGALIMIIPGHLAMIAALLLLAFTAKTSYIAFLAAGACYGIGMAIVSPTLNAIAIVDSPAERGATANATFYFMMDFGILFASAGFGALMDIAPSIESGYNQTFLISVGIIVFSAVFSLISLNKKAREKRSAV